MSLADEQKARGPWRTTVWPIYALFIGNIVSYVGDILTLLAIPWFVLQTTGNVIQTGITGLCATLPLVISGIFGSALIDRVGYKRISVIGDLFSGATVLLIPLLYHTIGLAFWQLLVLVFIGGLLKSPADTARAALVPELAKLAQMRLERANALDDGMVRVARFLGAPLAGVLIATIGTSNLLWLDACSFGFSAAIIGLSVPRLVFSTGQDKLEARKPGYLGSIGEGIRFIRHDAVVFTIVIVVMITNMLDNANFSVVQPAYILKTYHSAIPFGLLVAATGGTAFIGTIIFGSIGHRFPRRLTFGVCFILGGALRFWALLLPNFTITLIYFALAGFAISPLNSLISTVMQERIPQALRARVLGLFGAGVLAGIPLGTFISGFVVTWIGLRNTLWLMGGIYLLATLSILINPALKGMEKQSS